LNTVPVKPVAERTERLFSIDALRGIVMILMALDHVRDYFGAQLNPTDIATTTPALFLTRWITHFCAPIFILLAGMAAWLYASKGRSKAQVAHFLWTRGLWLIVLELTVINFGWLHSFDALIWQVIGAIGAAMIALSALVFLPQVAILCIGLVIVLGHNLLDPIELSDFDSFAPWWRLLHEGITPNFGLETVAGVPIMVIYPLIPWIGVIAIGYGLGPVMKLERRVRIRILLLIGTLSLLAFFALRAFKGYGNPTPFDPEFEGARLWFSFLNCTKYPPSLAYLLMTLGPAFIALALLDRKPSKLTSVCITFGSVPLFFYLMHLHLIHASSRVFHWFLYSDPASIVRSNFSWLPRAGYPDASFDPLPAEFTGLPITGVWMVWILIVLLLYPCCVWYRRIKSGSQSKWFSYL
jgi:uncharacterized membrane protein